MEDGQTPSHLEITSHKKMQKEPRAFGRMCLHEAGHSSDAQAAPFKTKGSTMDERTAPDGLLQNLTWYLELTRNIMK